MQPTNCNMAVNIFNELMQRMLELSVRKKILMEEIQSLTSSQSELLAPEKTEELLILIQRKQDCIDEINKIDADVLRLEENIASGAGLSSREEIKKLYDIKWDNVEKVRSETAQILKDTYRLDQENRCKIEEEYRKLRNNIESLHARKRSVKAYQGTVIQNEGYFIDRKK